MAADIDFEWSQDPPRAVFLHQSDRFQIPILWMIIIMVPSRGLDSTQSTHFFFFQSAWRKLALKVGKRMHWISTERTGYQKYCSKIVPLWQICEWYQKIILISRPAARKAGTVSCGRQLRMWYVIVQTQPKSLNTLFCSISCLKLRWLTAWAGFEEREEVMVAIAGQTDFRRAQWTGLFSRLGAGANHLKFQDFVLEQVVQRKFALPAVATKIVYIRNVELKTVQFKK